MARSRQLGVETLEQRDVPAVVFNPVFGQETIFWRQGNTAGHPDYEVVTSPISYNPTVLNSPQVYLIFRGASWTSTYAGRLASDAQAIIGSGYLSALQQYGSDGLATFGGYTIDSRAVDGNTTRDGEIQYILDNRMTSWTKPAGLAPNSPGGASNVGAAGYLQSPIYVVVYDNGDGYASNGGGFYSGTSSSGPVWYLTNGIQIDNGSNRDNFNILFSHELVERISDGTGAGIGMNAPSNVAGSGEYQNAQIADNEPDGGRYVSQVVGGVEVQAYWSIRDQAFIVPTSNLQNFVEDPIWNGPNSFSGQSVSLQDGYLFGSQSGGRISAALDRSVVAAYAIDSAGHLFDLTTSGQVRQYSGSGTSWTAVTGSNTHASALASAGGSVFMVANNTGGIPQVWQYNSPMNWSPLTAPPTTVSDIAATRGPSGQLYTLANNGGGSQVWAYSGSGISWTPLTDPSVITVNQIKADDVGLYMVGSRPGDLRKVWQFEGPRTSGDLYYDPVGFGYWYALTGAPTSVASIATAGGSLYMLADNGQGPQVWQYAGSDLSWTALTGTNTHPASIQADGGGLYMEAYNDGQPWHYWEYNGTPYSWYILS
jgi:hypothetical protein